MKLLIKNGRVLDPSSGLDDIADVYVADGTIVSVAKNIIADVDRVIDATNLWVTPGLIDIHVHLREPGFEYKETIATGTRSAARGGFTTICCMPNTNPVIDNEILVEYIKLKADREGVVNVLPIGSITQGQEGQLLSGIGKMVAAGICAVSEDGKSVLNSGLMYKAMQYVNMFDIPVLSHCEDTSLSGRGVMNASETSEFLGLAGINNLSEEIIVARDIMLAAALGTRIHICHVSTKGSIDLISNAKQKNINVTAEACPHHFTLTDKAVDGYNTNAKMNPPLRSDEDVASIKKALAEGIIDIIATDHAPHSFDDKNCEFDSAPFGIIGLETSVALSITELVNKNYLSPIELIAKMSYNPAKLLKLDKGTLKQNSVADITIIDPNAYYKINIDDFESKSKNSPFNNFQVTGKVLYTIVSGKIVFDNGK